MARRFLIGSEINEQPTTRRFLIGSEIQALEEKKKQEERQKIADAAAAQIKETPLINPVTALQNLKPIFSDSNRYGLSDEEYQKAKEYQSLPWYKKLWTIKPAAATKLENLQKADNKLGAFGYGLADKITLGASKQLSKAAGVDIPYDIAQEKHPVSYAAGELVGYIAPSIGSVAATKPITTAITKNIGSQLGKNVIEGAIAGAVVDTTEGFIEGDNPKELASRVGRGAVIGAIADTALYGLGKVGRSIIEKIKLGKALDNAEIEALNTLPDNVKDEVIKALPPVNRPLLAERNTSIIEMPAVKPKPLYGSIEDAANQNYEKVLKEYEDAVKKVQNYFQTNELRTDEIQRIKPELGIDFEDIVNRLDEAEYYKNNPEAFLKRERLRLTAGALTPEERQYFDELKIYKESQKGIPTYKLEESTYKQVPDNFKIERPFVAMPGETPNYKSMSESISEAAAVKEATQPKFKVDNQIYDTRQFTDTNGETLARALQKDEVMEQIIRDLDGADVKSDIKIQEIAPTVKNKYGIVLNMKDIYRNFRDVFGDNYDYVKKNYLDPFDASKKKYVDTIKQYSDDLYENVVKKYGINKDSKLSAAIQWYGEKMKPTGNMKVTVDEAGHKIKVPEVVEYTLEDLKREFPNDWQKVVEAEKWFRKNYDELLDKVNAVRAKIYPNNPDKLVPKRQDYFRHFRDISDTLEGVKNLFETQANIDPSLAGISEFTKPKSRWASFMQRRGMGKYKADAVGGFLDYLKAASYSINIDPHIARFRGLAKDLAEGTAKTKNANSVIKYINDFANMLAGKTSKYDRVFQDDTSRKFLQGLTWLNNRVKANQVLLNIRSTISQVFNLPQAIAKIKNPEYLIKGAGDTLAGIVDKDKAAIYNESQFLSERFMNNLFDRFDTKLIDQPKKFATWLLGITDEVSTKLTWNSLYRKALSEGIESPIKYADDVTRSLVAGRGIGEVPLLQQSKVFQLFAPFQLEVGNAWHVMGDFIKEKDFGGLIGMFIVSYLMNEAGEKLTGSRMVFDPIDALKDALKEDDASAISVTGRLAGEVLSNVPLGQTIASTVVPEYPAKLSTIFGEYTIPSRKELFGENDPTRYGSGLLSIKGLQDPLYKILPPFGGAQIKKTIEGLKAYNEGAVIKDGKLRFLVQQTPENLIKTAAFGKYSTDEARTYFEEDRRPLSEKQTQQVLKSDNPQKTYEKIMINRKINTYEDKLKEAKKEGNEADYERLKNDLAKLREYLLKLK